MPLQELAGSTAAMNGWGLDKHTFASQDSSAASVASSDCSAVWPPPGLRPVLLASVVAVFNFVKRSRKHSRNSSKSCRNSPESEQATQGVGAVHAEPWLPGLVQRSVVDARIDGQQCIDAQDTYQSIEQWAHHQALSASVLSNSTRSADPRPVFSEVRADGATSPDDHVTDKPGEQSENAPGPKVPTKPMDDAMFSRPLQEKVSDRNVQESDQALHAGDPEIAQKENAAKRQNRTRLRPGLFKEIRSMIDNEFANPVVFDRFEGHELSPARGLVDILRRGDTVRMAEIGSSQMEKIVTIYENPTAVSLSSEI
jgi:hypothetical protein